jgi:hypothetical protein
VDDHDQTIEHDNGASGDATHVPPLRTRRVVLKPVSANDYDALRMLELGDSLGPRWRYRGSTPSPETFAQTLWASVLAQYLVCPANGDGPPAGVLVCYGADMQDGFAYVAAAKFDRSRPSPMVLEGCIIFLEYLFACWPFRKLYFESMEFNLVQFKSGLDRLLHEEGRLRSHSYLGGRYWDQVTMALYRDEWRESRWYERLVRPVPVTTEH